MARQTYDETFAFYEQLRFYYTTHRGVIKSKYKGISKKILSYNDREERPEAFLRPPQFEALEMYVFFKEFLNNSQVAAAFDAWRRREGVFSDATRYSRGQATLFDTLTEKQTNEIFRQMKGNEEAYPNYIFALTMGLGKTILMATCIFYEFLLANKFPKDTRFCHNALVFAPDRTVLQSLKEIVTFDKSLVIPPEYVKVLDNNLRIHFLEDAGTTLATLDGSDFNLIISNDQKIIAKRKRTTPTAGDELFSMPSGLLGEVYGDDGLATEGDLILNQRFEKLCRLPQLGVYVDEAHHLFGATLQKALSDKKNESSLRRTINLISDALAKNGSGVVACYNYTGTPYVNNKILPEVIYAYGLSQSISMGYLKSARVLGYENVKSEGFLRRVVTDFWERYGENTYEGLLPKLAIFAADLKEVREDVLPALERILSDLDVSTGKILVNTGDTKQTSEADIHVFNNLDNPESGGNEKQFIVLVQKGREGWNCRSLFGVALFRSPKSKVFVLQATMRCLRQITDVQQEATVYLSKDNYDILEDELNKNFNINIDGLGNKKKDEGKRIFHVRVVPPERTVKVNRIRHKYSLVAVNLDDEVTIGLDDVDVSKYQSVVYEKKRLQTEELAKQHHIEVAGSNRHYSSLELVAEIARYLGPSVSCMDVENILRRSCEGLDKIVAFVSDYNDALYDIVIPAVWNALYRLNVDTVTSEEEVVLLRTPKDGSSYDFTAKPELTSSADEAQFTSVKGKSFHADTYCFDSKPEKELFMQYIFSDKVARVYFTGMFTSGQGDFAVQYVDPESYRIRTYYPDFYAELADGSLEMIEVKGDNMIDDEVVKAKAAAAEEIATASDITYRMLPGNYIMKHDVFEDPYPQVDVEYDGSLFKDE